MLLVRSKRRANTFSMIVRQSPKGRRSVCYDREALKARKKHKPKNSAIDMAATMSIEILTEQQYRELQTLGTFDTRTLSWVKTPSEIKNSAAPSFVIAAMTPFLCLTTGRSLDYAARGFRGSLKV